MTAQPAASVHVMCGIVGAGKATVAKRLADGLPAVRLSRDEWMLRTYGWSYDDPRYVEALPQCTENLQRLALEAPGQDRHVVLDWNHWSRARRAESARFARDAGHECIVHFVDVSVDEAIRRATLREDSTSHSLDEAGVRHSANLLEEPTDVEGLLIVRHNA